MAKDDGLWVILLLLAASRRSSSAPGSVSSIALPAGEWVWPMLTLPDGRRPEISDGFGSPRDSGKRKHKGVDIMYRREHPLTKVKYPLPDHGSAMFEVPQGAPVVAAHAGRVWSTGKTPLGHYVIIDHGPEPWSTFYQHLEALTIPPHRRGKQANGARGLELEVATPLGIAGHSLADGQQIRHLHFELRRGKTAIDPWEKGKGLMKDWRKL
jgi:murein DD-endopeptidase MepM/ murein hydrolase activator NlpD